MAKTIAHYLSDLRIDLKDSGSVWSDTELTRCVEKAVADLSRFLPDQRIFETVVDAEVDSESFTSPAASDPDYFVDAMDISASVDGATGTLATRRPDMPRPVLITITDANTSITQLHIIVKGFDVDNKYIEESFWLEGGLVQTGSKYFAFISEVEIDEIAGNGAGDLLDVGTGSHLGIWVQLSTKAVKHETETITGYTRDTDYEVDYTSGRVALKTGSTMSSGTAYTVKYTKSRIVVDLSSIRSDLIRIERVEFPVGQLPQIHATFEVWGSSLILLGDHTTQYEATDAQHIAILYTAPHSPPSTQSPGSYPSFLDTTVQLAAGAYALFIEALQYEQAAVTDFASMRTELGLTTAVHTTVTTALTNLRKYLNNNTAADAAGILQDITDDIADLRTAIATALGAAATELGLVGTNSLDKVTTGAEAYLDSGDDTINTLNTGGNTVPERYAQYAQTRAQIGQTRVAEAATYVQEAQTRISNLRSYIEQAGGYNRIAEDFAAEAQSALAQIQGYLQEAAHYNELAQANLLLADRLRAEGIERRNEAWAIWKNPPDYAPQYSIASRSQVS